MIRPPSMELRAKRSGAQAMMPSASPASRRSIIATKTGRPGVFALFASTNSPTICMSECTPKTRANSERWLSIDMIWRSSASDDFLQYTKYLIASGTSPDTLNPRAPEPIRRIERDG